MLCGRDRLRILAMFQIMARATVPIAQPPHCAVNRIDTDLDLPFLTEQRLQVANTPGADWPAIGFRSPLQRVIKQRQVVRTELGRSTGASSISQAVATAFQKPPAPDSHPVWGRAEPPGDPKH